MNTTPQTSHLGKRNMDDDSFHTPLPYLFNNSVPSAPIKKGRRNILLDELVPINLFAEEVSGFHTPNQHHNLNYQQPIPVRRRENTLLDEVVPINLFPEDNTRYSTPNRRPASLCPPIVERNREARVFYQNINPFRLESIFNGNLNDDTDIFIRFPEIMF
jgi:hypothetical protein